MPKKPYIVIPNYVKEISNHLKECAFERNCIFCSNVLAFALVFAEQNNMFKDESLLGPNNSSKFWKLIQSMSTYQNKCPHAISRDKMAKIDDWLGKLSITQSIYFRDEFIFSNSEFKTDAFQNYE